MLLVDPPSCWTSKATDKTQFSDPNTDFVGTRSKSEVLLFPRLKQANPLLEYQLEDFLPSGAVTAISALTDAQRRALKAPAGQEAALVGVPQLSVSLTNDENGVLIPLGINWLRGLPSFQAHDLGRSHAAAR